MCKGWLLAACECFFMDLMCPCDCTGMGFHVVMAWCPGGAFVLSK